MRLPFAPQRTIDVVTTPLIAIVVTLTAASMTRAQQFPSTNQDPVIGQWRLDVSKSKYAPGPGPKSETRTYQLTGEGIKAVIVRTRQDGQVETIEVRSQLRQRQPRHWHTGLRRRAVDADQRLRFRSHALARRQAVWNGASRNCQGRNDDGHYVPAGFADTHSQCRAVRESGALAPRSGVPAAL